MCAPLGRSLPCTGRLRRRSVDVTVNLPGFGRLGLVPCPQAPWLSLAFALLAQHIHLHPPLYVCSAARYTTTSAAPSSQREWPQKHIAYRKAPEARAFTVAAEPLSIHWQAGRRAGHLLQEELLRDAV